MTRTFKNIIWTVILLIFSTYAHAEIYGSYDEIKLDSPKVGTRITLNILGCEISNGPYDTEFKLKCVFVKGTQDVYLYVTKQEAKPIVSNKGYQNFSCLLTEVGSSFVSCTTRQDYLKKEVDRINKNAEIDKKLKGNK